MCYDSFILAYHDKYIRGTENRRKIYDFDVSVSEGTECLYDSYSANFKIGTIEDFYPKLSDAIVYN